MIAAMGGEPFRVISTVVDKTEETDCRVYELVRRKYDQTKPLSS